MKYYVDLGTVKSGDKKDFTVTTNKSVEAAVGSCWCTSTKISGNTVSATIACHGNSGTKQERTINGTYTDGEGFKIEIQFKIA
jgi:hypothetical protein